VIASLDMSTGIFSADSGRAKQRSRARKRMKNRKLKVFK